MYNLPFHLSNIILDKVRKTNEKRYGVDNFFKRKDFQKINKQTRLQKYNDENYTNRKKANQTKKDKYGDINYNNQEKAKKTTP